MKISKKKVAAALGAGAIAAAGSGIAFAYWTASGDGTGSAATGSITDGISVVQTSTVSGLYPDSTPQALSGDFKNSNDSPAYVTSVTVSLDSISGGGTDSSIPDCTTADFALSATSNGSATDNGDGTFTIAVGHEIAGRAGYDNNADDGSWSGVSVQLVDGPGNQDNCKNATLNLAYTSA